MASIHYKLSTVGVTIPIKPSKDKFELFRLNLESYCDKLAPKLNLWKTRGLSLLGKITILKSLILPKLYYELFMLPTEIHSPFIKQLNALIYGFIWGSKWERISRLNLACSVEMGGAKMLHLPFFVLALQWKHLQHFFHQRSTFLPLWYILETGLISEPLIQSVLNSNLRIYNRRISSLVPFRFLKVGLYAAKKLFNWDSHQFKFLWLNSNVKYRRTTLYIEEFANAGINYHYQLVDDNNNYLSFGDLAQKYDLRNENELFLKYVKLYLSIPEKWEGNISSFQCTPNNYLEMVKENCRDKWQSTKKAYTYLMGDIFPEKHQRRWANDLLLDFDSINWPIIYKNNYYCTLETKLRSFQIKLNLRAIVCNSQLFGFGMIENDLCTFCKKDSETVLHLFCTCTHVRKFWDDISSWLSHHFKCNIILNSFTKLFGFEYFESNTKTVVLNCFLLNARFSVFRHKCNNTKPTIESFLHSMRFVKSSEYIVAKHTGNLRKHYFKWTCV